ncbi:MAG: TolC family protein [Saprospiraceae bacterium]|nr:TolC family protein [Saprospiraceae bacterium]
MIIRTFLIAVVLMSFTELSGQARWSLEKCIQYAQQNNLTIKLSELNVRDAVLQNRSAKQAMLPNLNASVGAGLQFGRRIDPVSNDFITDNVGFNSGSLSSGITIYNGSKLRNSVKRSGLDMEAAKEDLAQTGQDIALMVAVSYLTILQVEDQLENAKKRLELSLVQLEQTDKLIEAGSLPAADLQNIEAQVAQDEQIVVARENDLVIAYLDLQQMLELDPDKQFLIERPDIDIPEDQEALEVQLTSVYNQALNNQPGIKASELRVRSAQLGIKIAEADRLPVFSAFGDISTNYSNKSFDFENPDLSNSNLVLGPEIPVEINSYPAQLATFNLSGVEYQTLPYFDQITDNFGQSLGLNLSIPIYNRGQINTNIQRAEIALQNNEILEKQAKQQLKQDIQRALADARAAHKNYLAASKAESALATAYFNTERKYKLGASNTLEFTTSKNQLDLARVDTIIAKYDFIFKLKVVDFYQGKKIDL